ILAYTVGVVIASMGKENVGQSLKNLIKVPAIYAMVLALIFVYAGWKLPLPVERATRLLGEASIPTMLVLLGMQLRSVRLAGNIVPLLVASSVRLIVSPALAIVLSMLFQIQGSFQQASVMQAAMPAAVLTTVLATEYDVVPEFVTSVVFTTTLLSIFTITPLMAFLGS
ncbi:MAG: AEC family transporter, partial [Chloroflexota bacterium]|nr:AEC family transporter [Chloroflexota bacterium]